MLPKIEFTDGPSNGDALVLGCFQQEGDEKAKTGSETALQFLGKRSKEIESLLERLRQSKHFSARKNEASLLRFFPLSGFPNVMLLGLGLKTKWTVEQCRQAGAAVFLSQRKEKLAKVVLQSDSVFTKARNKELAQLVQAFCEGYLLASYEFKELKKKEEEKPLDWSLTLGGLKNREVVEAAHKASVLSKAVFFARLLGDRPGNYMTPVILAEQAEKMAREVGLKCTVWDKKAIEKEKMGLLLGVSQGSHQEPRFIILEHRGGKKGDAPVALVGKGVTFDTGGISLKPANQMEDMKYDMMGAATVIACLQIAAALKLPLNVTGYVAATENMPGGSATKPGDVHQSRHGKTVEIINTDAEGRLILADALEYAQDQKPQAVVDFATLTGAVVVALGSITSGIMGNHRGLIERIKVSSDSTGERVWELPLYEEYEEDLKSHCADIKNSGTRDAGSQKAGIFLKFFVDAKCPWAHCDIAGTAYHRKDLNYSPSKSASGTLIRAMAHLLENWKPLKANSFS